MPLVPFDLPPDAAPLPDAVRAFLAAAQRRVDQRLAAHGTAGAGGFVPCDHELVYRSLRALRTAEPSARRLCEWGSGLGVVAGLAASLGYEVHGIEIDRDLIAAARDLLAAHGLAAELWHGSFVPEEFARAERLSDLETRTVMSAADAYGEMELDIDDFDVVYAYPWPTEEEQYCALFQARGNVGAVLLTFSQLEGVRAYRKVGGSRRRR